MNRKQRILRMINRLDDEVSYEHVLYQVSVMREIDIGLEQAERGELIDHDELMAQLDAEDAQDQARLDTKGGRSPAKHQKVHRSKLAAKRHRLHKTPKARTGKTKKVS